MSRVPRFEPGKPIAAADLNRLAELAQERPLGPLDMQRVMAYLLTVLAPDRFVLGLLTAVNASGGTVNPDNARTAYASEAVTYDAQGIDKPSVVVTAATPYHRPVAPGEGLIYPPAVGDTCLIERYRKSDGSIEPRLHLMPEAEVRAFRRCTGGGGGS